MSAEKTCIRWGLMGLGKIASQAIVPAFSSCQDSQLVAIGSGRLERAQSELQKIKGFEGLDVFSYEDLIQRPDIDAIFIALPNHLHREWTLKALDAGKHVMCEKPLGLNLSEAQEMTTRAKSVERLVAEAFMYRHHPQMAVIKEQLASGAIGDIRLIRSHFSYQLSDLSNIRLKAECGGGALLDVGCYGIDVSRFLTNEEPNDLDITSVMGAQSGVDERSTVDLVFLSGIQAQVFCATDSYRENRVEIFGTTGKMDVPSAFVMPPNKIAHVLVHNDAGQQVIKVPAANAYSLELEAFSRSIRMGELEYPLEDGLAGALTLEMDH
jgi:xylose dehydrogenase (NAD/NADP)